MPRYYGPIMADMWRFYGANLDDWLLEKPLHQLVLLLNGLPPTGVFYTALQADAPARQAAEQRQTWTSTELVSGPRMVPPGSIDKVARQLAAHNITPIQPSS